MEGFPQIPREHVVPTEEMLNDLAELYKIFGDSTRIKILYTLFDQARGVGEIAYDGVCHFPSAADFEAGAFGKIPTGREDGLLCLGR